MHTMYSNIVFVMCLLCPGITADVQKPWTVGMVSPAPPAWSTSLPNLPSTWNSLWYRTPGTTWSKDWLPVGNGYLAAMTPGGTSQEIVQLNIESLWSGGPFQDSTYNGGNKAPSEQADMAADMQGIRDAIFSSPTGTIDNIEVLGTDPGAYGSYAGAGHLVSTLNITGNISTYVRWLDMDQASTTTTWRQDGLELLRTTFCSNPAKACVQHLNATEYSLRSLPEITYAFSSSTEPGLPPPSVTCLDSSTLVLRGNVSNPGMGYELMARASAVGQSANISCFEFPGGPGVMNATLTVTGAEQAWVTWVGDTDYDMDAGNASHGFSFRKASAGNLSPSLLSLLGHASPRSATSATYDTLLWDHIRSYDSLLGNFSISLGQTRDLTLSTDELIATYQTDVGNPYLEWLLFNYGRYLLASSAPGILPVNLQGKWASDISNPWSADYHSNINIQMNYWFAEMTNMNLVTPLFDYIEKTWAPRGAETAQVLYNITRGFVTHNEMNIFGHTGMKLAGNSAQWANYPESAVWMMFHVWDHFDYTNDIEWFKAQGWPLLKGVAGFHLDKLIPDKHFNDTTLVVSPCNSPEQIPITFGCAHAQQMIWQLFNAIEKGFDVAGDNDLAFLQEVRTKRSLMDKGIRIGAWGQLQEWKVDMDSPTDVHRHLSHLIGLYPGYALTSYDPRIQGPPEGNGMYTTDEVLAAVQTSLLHRGDGTGPDGDAGWEKVWRAAAWAQLGNATAFYHQLTYGVERNFGPNLFSLYNPFDPNPIFQIDANFGYPAAVLNALIQAPDVPSYSTPLVVTILPALPAAWPSGRIQNAKIRGGITVSELSWQSGRGTQLALTVDKNARSRQLRVVYGGSTVISSTTFPGLRWTIDLTVYH